MKITIDVRDLVREIKAVFPDLDETKLKAAMFDLVMNIDSGAGGEIRPSQTVPAARDAKVARPEKVETKEEESEQDSDQENLSGLDKVLGSDWNTKLRNVDEPSGWGDMAKTARPIVQVEDAFGFEDDETPQTNAGDKAPPTGRGGVGKKPEAARRDAQRKARQSLAKQFEGKSDLEIAQMLTEQAESKLKRSSDGQFTDLGSDNVSDDSVF